MMASTFPHMLSTKKQSWMIRLQFEISQVANLRYRNGEATQIIVHTTFPYMHGTNTQIYVRLRFEIAQVANLRYRNGEATFTSHHGPKTFPHMLSTKKHSWMFACSSRLRRLQTCATGAHSLYRVYRSGPE